jgi:hypothetical protein
MSAQRDLPSLQRRHKQVDLHVPSVEAAPKAADSHLTVSPDDEVKVLVAVDVDGDEAWEARIAQAQSRRQLREAQHSSCSEQEPGESPHLP